MSTLRILGFVALVLFLASLRLLLSRSFPGTEGEQLQGLQGQARANGQPFDGAIDLPTMGSASLGISPAQRGLTVPTAGQIIPGAEQ